RWEGAAAASYSAETGNAGEDDRGSREGQRRHRGIDVEAALPAAQTEEEHDERHPAQQQKEASVSPDEPASPGGYQPRQAGDGGEPDHRDPLHQEEPEGLAMLP